MIRLKDLRYNHPGNGWSFFSQRNSELSQQLRPRKPFSMVWARPLDAAFGPLENDLSKYLFGADNIP